MSSIASADIVITASEVQGGCLRGGDPALKVVNFIATTLVVRPYTCLNILPVTMFIGILTNTS